MDKSYPIPMMIVTLLISTSAAIADPNECSTKSNFISSWYTGASLDLSTNVWTDLSGNGNDGSVVDDEGIGIYSDGDDTNELYLNNEPVVYGSKYTKVHFEPYVTADFTVFNLCKYPEEGLKQRIIQSSEVSSIFGFFWARSGVASADGWITDGSVIDRFGTDWVLSSMTKQLYRGNAVDFTEGSGSGADIGQLMINDGAAATQISDWSCAELIIVNDQELDLDEIECIEQYFNDKYDLNLDFNTDAPITTDIDTTDAITAVSSCDALDIDGFLDHCSTLWDTRDDEIDIMSANIDTNSENIGINSDNVGINTGNIATNTANIDAMSSNLGTNTDVMDANTVNIATLTTRLDDAVLQLEDLSNPVFSAQQIGVGVLDDFGDKFNNIAVIISMVSLMINIILLTFGCYIGFKLNNNAKYQKLRSFGDSDTEHQSLKS